VLTSICWIVIIWYLLDKNERDLFAANIISTSDTLERYSNCLGETFREFIDEVNRMRGNIKK